VRERYDVAVIGAGPYGLSAAAHLLDQGLHVAVFGKPLQLWREHMPRGMFLRSHWWATELSDPKRRYGFAAFLARSRHRPTYPVPIEVFIEYGLWFQRHAVPQVDATLVSTVERDGRGFALTLEDGRAAFARAVVLAVGLKYYANVPDELARLSPELVSHSFAHADCARFAGRRVAVVGGGQSAVEYAALLHEAGARVHLIARRPIRWLAPDRDQRRTWIDQLQSPRAGIAPGWINWTLEAFPYLFHRLPQSTKDWYTSTHYGPAANDWLRDRVFGRVELHERQGLGGAREGDRELSLTLTSGRALSVDHLMLATGYRVSLARLPMLSTRLKAAIRADEDAPLLDPWFQTSVPGLYLLGLSSVRSFGPLYRFVVGAKAAAPRVASAVARQVLHV
jgi:cation diffusion facilitator CzcD-associated flavoprotein CzcO